MTNGDNIQKAREAFYDEISGAGLAPLWTVLSSLVSSEPRPRMLPASWRYQCVREYLMKAGDLIGAEEAERRVLMLENPAARGQARITQSLYAGLQLILPGEIAPCHRHTQSALRFVMEGEGAYTAVDGEKAFMSRFDLVLTRARAWHEHGNASDGPMIWLDGLDIPMVSFFDASFSEKLPNGQSEHAETRPAGDTIRRHDAHLRLVAGAGESEQQDFFHYRFTEWRRALLEMTKQVWPDESDGVMMEFRNPRDGGSVMPTISAFCSFFPCGFSGQSRRTTEGVVSVVVEGEGEAQIGDELVALEPRTVLVTPPWTHRRVRARSDLILFSYSDRAAQQRLGLWRQEARGAS